MTTTDNFLCPICAIDMEPMSEDESRAHLEFHVHMVAAPKSIPHFDKPALKTMDRGRRQNGTWAYER